MNGSVQTPLSVSGLQLLFIFASCLQDASTLSNIAMLRPTMLLLLWAQGPVLLADSGQWVGDIVLGGMEMGLLS